LAGLLEATLSAPVLAMAIRITRRVRQYEPDATAVTGGEEPASD